VLGCPTMRDRSVTRSDGLRTGAPAWFLSVLIHLALVLVVGLALHALTEGAAEQPTRTVGIVLKHSGQDGVRYESEEDQAARRAADTTATASIDEATLAALPNQNSIPDPTDALPARPVIIGPGPAGGPGMGPLTGLGGDGNRRPSGGAGSSARVGLFGVVGEGRKFVYVFDCSTSMGEGGRLAAAKEELVRSLDALDSTHQFQIIFFNHRQRVFDLSGGQRRIPFATRRAKQLAAAFVGSIVATGSTNRFDALKRAVAMRPDVVFFLTDDDNPMSADELAQIRRKNQGVCAIHAIQFGDRPTSDGENFLVRLARQNGGQYVYLHALDLTAVPDPQE